MKSLLLISLLFLALLAGCKKPVNPASLEQASAPIEAVYQVIRPEPLVVKSSQPGRLEAYKQAEVRARVPGIVLKRFYEEGLHVKAGDVLFQIDPASLQADLDAAAAALKEAEANYSMMKDRRSRYSKLVENKAISEMEMQQADSEMKQADARIGSAKAAQEAARLKLEFATVTSPIEGRARRAAVTEGALVGEGDATLLTTVEQINPIYVNFTQPVSEVMALRKALNKGQLQGFKQDEVKVQLVMDHDTVYPEVGELIFSDLSVDAKTDAVQLRALVPNPNQELFPGMFVRVKMDVAMEKSAILVPRDAVLRTSEGASVVVINDKNEATSVSVVTKEIYQGRWHVISGLSGGERLVVQNASMIPAGTVVTPVEAK